MADTTASHDLGEIWGKVEGLESNFAHLGKQVESGFRSITEAINSNHEKTDRRITDLDRATNERFQREQSNYRQGAAQRSSATLTVIGIMITAMLGLGGLFTGVVTVGATIYTFTKQPIDQSLSDLHSQVHDVQESQKNFVPSAEVKIISKRSEDNETAIGKINVDLAAIKKTADTAEETNKLQDKVISEIGQRQSTSIAERAGLQKQVDSFTAQIAAFKTNVEANLVSRPENENRWADVQYRVNTLAEAVAVLRKSMMDGNNVGDRINTLSRELEALKNQFIMVPGNPQYKRPETGSKE